MKRSKRHEQFVERILHNLQTVPKMSCFVQNILNSADDSSGEHFVEYSSGKHSMHIRLSEFRTFPLCTCVIAHECIHAALSDIFLTFNFQGLLQEDLIDLINERSAHVSDQVVEHIFKNLPSIEKKYADLKAGKIKHNTFLRYVISPIHSIPKCEFSVRETLDSANSSVTQHSANDYTARHTMNFREDAFDSIESCLASIAFECLLAGLFDLSLAVEYAGLITENMATLLRDRPAQVVHEIVFNLMSNYSQLKIDFESLKEKTNEKNCSIRSQEENGERHSRKRVVRRS